MAKTRHGVVALMIAATLLAACGGSKKTATDETTSSAEGASTNSSVDVAATSAASSSSSANSSGGNTGGNAAGLPSNFPTDRIPVPSDVTVTNSTSVDGGDTLTYFVSFTTGKSVGDISDYYAGVLQDRGWHKIIEQDLNGSRLVSYSSKEDGSGDILNVTATPNPESSSKTDVGLQVGITK
jgi:hypothetical protein